MDYKNGKIYKITDIGYNKMYIGSTTQPLYKRFNDHKSKYKHWKNGKDKKITSYDLFEEFGIDNCKIELIEEFACENRDQLQKKEGEHIKNNICVNKLIAGRTRQETTKEYRESNKDKIKEYNEINKEHIKEYKKKYREITKERYKQYCEKNKEHIKERKKKYRELNKQHIKEYNKQYYESKKNNSKSLEIPTD